jgi:hypothetical protein
MPKLARIKINHDQLKKTAWIIGTRIIVVKSLWHSANISISRQSKSQSNMGTFTAKQQLGDRNMEEFKWKQNVATNRLVNYIRGHIRIDR